jgi:TatD DNase family protein
MTNDQRPLFVDSHAHLDGEQFQADREQVIVRAREAGVETIVAIGNGDGPGSLDCGIKLAEQYEFIYATVAFTPTKPSWPPMRLAEMEQRAQHPRS